MRILIVGGDGMLGHQLLKHFQGNYEVKVTLHQALASYQQFGLYHQGNSFTGIDIANEEGLMQCLASFQPNVVINCIGLLKQREEKNDVYLNLQVNAVFPHKLSLYCQMIGARLIQMSTDCVFNGKANHYTEDTSSNAQDCYGRTKFLGELHQPHTITLRSSIIGFELKNFRSLLSWFMSQAGGKVKGFKQAIYSGFTTLEMARIIEHIITQYPEKYGVYQVASQPISKYDLLQLVNEKCQLNIEIEADEQFSCYRHLDGSRFNQEFAYTPPQWDVMISEIANIYHAQR